MSRQKPKVVVIATGGTIAGLGVPKENVEYTVGKLPIDDLIAAVPAASEIADLVGIQLVSIGSQDMTSEVWLKLAQTLAESLSDQSVAGAVVTHGTDTMEETAYFLNLIVDTAKPVVMTGAMRPASSLSADGPLNLFNSVAIAASKEAADHGVMVVANDFIHGAREVTKTNTLTVQAFESSDRGLLGTMHYGALRMYRKPHRRHTYQSDFSISEIENLPPVAVIYAHADMTGGLIDSVVSQGVQGIVLAGVGNGNASKDALEALRRATQAGVIVVRSTRSNDGAVLRNQEVDDDGYGFVVSDQLNPAKARVLLQLALTRSKDAKQIQEFFFAY